MSDFKVVVCGGGIAAVEGILRLRKLAGDSVDIKLVAPNEHLVMRPLAVRQPFAFGAPNRYPLARIAADTGAELVVDTLGWVDADARVVHTGDGEEIPFDALLVAVGAKQAEAYPHVRTFADATADESFQGVVQDIEGGYSSSVAFLLPDGPVYPLPIYELALMTAQRAREMSMDVDLHVVTAEASPLAIFGGPASEAIARTLDEAGITVHTSAQAQVPGAGKLLVQPQALELHPERMLAMPRIEGPGIRGLSGGGAHGFIPIDMSCGVPGTGGRVFAAGDAAAYPVKHGGVGAQMADTAAGAIARLAGVEIEQQPFWPHIRGKVFGPPEPLYISAQVVGGKGFESEVHESPPWPEDDKVVAEELGPYLAALDDAGHATG